MNSLVAVHPEWVLVDAIGLAANRQPDKGAISKNRGKGLHKQEQGRYENGKKTKDSEKQA